MAGLLWPAQLAFSTRDEEAPALLSALRYESSAAVASPPLLQPAAPPPEALASLTAFSCSKGPAVGVV